MLRVALAILFGVPGLVMASGLFVTVDVWFQLRPSQEPTSSSQLFISPNTGGNQHTSLTPTINSPGLPAIAFGGGATGNNGQAPDFFFSASANGVVDATAWFGTLHASAEASATVDPTARVNTPTQGVNMFYPASYVAGTASFQDTFQVLDPNLPLGAPVSFFLSGIVDGDINGTGEAAGNYGGCISVQTSTGTFALFGAYGSDNCCGCCGRRTATAMNGETATIQGQVFVNVRAYAGYFDNEPGVSPTVGLSDLTVDAFNTMHVYMYPITTNLELIAASGHNYATGALSDEPVGAAVPEPASILLGSRGFIALAALVFAARRSTTSA